MRHERGGATLTAVMTLMLLGTLLLHGLGELFTLRMPGVAGEIRRIRATAQAHNALAWGATQPWAAQTQWQCRQAQGGGKACVRQFEHGLLLLGQDDGGVLYFWQRGQWRDGKVALSPRSWSDFCPLAVTAQCLP